MKKLLSIIILGLFFVVLGCEKDSLFDTTLDDDIKVSVRATDTEIEDMIEGGVAWLLTNKNGDGSFSWGQEIVARTAMAVVKLCDKSIEEGFQPLDPDGPYYTQIQEALAFIMSHEQIKGPDQKLYNILGNAHHDNYNGSWALMAFCATRDAGYLTIAQQAANFFIENRAPNGAWGYNAEGGWDDNQSWQDNSNTGYVVLSLVAAANFGCSIPAAVVDDHKTWVNYIQNPVDGDPDDGGSGYTQPNEWVNMIKTGNLLFEMAFVGDKPTDSRVQDAVDYLERHWGDLNQDPGFRPNNYQAMYTMMKGLTALGIDAVGPYDWYGEFTDMMYANKLGVPGNYYWPADGMWADEYISTVFALLTLEKVVELPRIEVYLDIKPTSCPNPFNMGANGVLPVAILGSPDCDVTQIDVSSLTLAGVPPIVEMTGYEDVAAPLYDPTEECECTTAGPDGYMDLTLKFNRQAIAEALGDVEDGDMVPLTITGFLANGLELTGTDCIWIKKKGKK